MESEEFKQGYESENILDNPYWTNYPAEVSFDEKCKARRFVDGWYQRCLADNKKLVDA